MRFINDDVKLRNGGRTAVRISKEELERKIYLFSQDDENEEYETLDDKLYYGEVWLNRVSKDLKYKFDTENMSISVHETFGNSLDGPPLLGFQTLSNGFTFLGVQAGGDWEYPIFFILYWDGKRIRAYIPSYGNAVNLDTKTAFGSEDETGWDTLVKLYKKYNKIPASEPIEDIGDTCEWSNMYLKKYDIKSVDDIKFCWDAIKKDILSRITVR